MTTTTCEQKSVILAGFGMVAAGNVDDPVMGKAYRYSTHVQALLDHPEFSIAAVIDPSDAAREKAQSKWNIRNVYSEFKQLPSHIKTDVLVLATPPQHRLPFLERLSGFKALIVEKPLGVNQQGIDFFADTCAQTNLPVQVHFWRRFVPAFQKLKAGQLKDLIGDPHHILIEYGNGVRNNGIHLIDFVRMLVGEITTTNICGEASWPCLSPVPGDKDLILQMQTETGVSIHMRPVDFNHYRENGIVITGNKGTLSILNDCRVIRHIPIRKHRGLSDNMELAYDAAQFLECDFDLALYNLYENLFQHMENKTPLNSPLQDALKSEAVVESIFEQKF